MGDYYSAARSIARKYGYCPKIAAEINGKLLYLDEGEVRALQLLAKEKAKESDEDFAMFCKKVVIYSNTTKRKSGYTMIFRKDGQFENDFECGFMTAVCQMTFDLL